MIAHMISEYEKAGGMSERGSVFIEYFVIAMAVFLAVLAFYNKGDFMGAKPKVEAAFDSLAAQIAGP